MCQGVVIVNVPEGPVEKRFINNICECHRNSILNMDRIDFSEKLFSTVVPEGTSVEDIQKKTRPISEAISQMMPSSLFRYRAYSSNAVDAFKNDIMYAVTADMFNDPYDTLVGYDLQGIERGVDAAMNTETLAQLKTWLAQGNDFPEILEQSLPKEMLSAFKENLLSIDDFKAVEGYLKDCKSRLISLIETFFPILSQASKRFSTIACFSESVQSILMWSHYACSHTGFALEYNFRPTLKTPIKNVIIAPVVYQDQRLDISSYIVWAFLIIMGIKTKNPDISASIKNALYKSVDWAYEKEWRLIDSTPRDYFDKSPSAIPFRPVAVYYGQNMSLEHKQELHTIASEKGIKEFEMYLDYSSPKYEMLFRTYELR